MKTFKIMLMAFAMALFLSLPADSFAMGGRHGSNNNGQQNDKDKDKKSSKKDKHDEDENTGDVSGNGFFGEKENHDPFYGIVNDENNGDNDDSDDEDDDEDWGQSNSVSNIQEVNIPQDPSAIPEPATMGLMLLGGVGAGLMKRKKSKV